MWLADSHVNNLLSSNLVAYGPRRKRKADGQVVAYYIFEL